MAQAQVTWYGYPLSGLAQWGISARGIERRSYTLWSGRSPREEYGPTTLIAPLTPAAVSAAHAAVAAARDEHRPGILAAIALAAGATTAVNYTGTPVIMPRA